MARGFPDTRRAAAATLALAAALLLAQTPREELRAVRKVTPKANWPRMTGHVVLAWPGSAQEQKGYHEPGGSFSPSPGSFGLQIQIFDSEGRVAAASDSLALSEIRQRLLPGPAIETVTRG